MRDERAVVAAAGAVLYQLAVGHYVSRALGPSPRSARARSSTGRGLGARCELVAGDFFESVPAGGDAYLLKHVIHDWDDAQATAILKRLPHRDEAGRAAADHRGRLAGAASGDVLQVVKMFENRTS